MDHSNSIVEIGLAALKENVRRQECITDENLTHKTITALKRHPENILEIVLTSLVLFGEQEANAKLLLHLAHVADCINGEHSPAQELLLAA